VSAAAAASRSTRMRSTTCRRCESKCCIALLSKKEGGGGEGLRGGRGATAEEEALKGALEALCAAGVAVQWLRGAASEEDETRRQVGALSE
jgi:hypothetical protein